MARSLDPCHPRLIPLVPTRSFSSCRTQSHCTTVIVEHTRTSSSPIYCCQLGLFRLHFYSYHYFLSGGLHPSCSSIRNVLCIASRLLPIHVSPFSPPSYILHIDPRCRNVFHHSLPPYCCCYSPHVCRIVRTTLFRPLPLPLHQPPLHISYPEYLPALVTTTYDLVLAIDSHSRVIAVPTRSFASTLNCSCE